MSILTPKAFSRFGALDSDAVSDGRYASAHTLRAMAMSSNRLAIRQHCLLNMGWDADLDSAIEAYLDSGVHIARATPWWRPVTPPIPARKMPLARSATLYAKLGVSDADRGVVALQVATLASPFSDSMEEGPSMRVFEGSTLGDLQGVDEVMSEIPIREGVDERIQFFVRGTISDNLADEETYGEYSAGDIEGFQAPNIMKSASASWNTSGDTLAVSSHCLRFMDQINGDFIDLVMPREIVLVKSGDELVFRPALTDEEQRIVMSAENPRYRVFQIPFVRLVHLSMYSNEVAL